MTCFDAYKNLNIVNHRGQLSIGPCCLAPTTPVTEIDFYNNNFLKSIRDSWDRNQFPPACNSCKLQESRGELSRRISVTDWYADRNISDTTTDLLKIDYWTGNTCNLRCAICGPANSSSWEQELNIPSRHQILNPQWTNLDISNLQSIHFNGGEPLLSKEHVNFLNAVPVKELVEINYNTNATIIPNSELLNLWSKFKCVILDFSIDDIGERFEYQRYPAKWDNIVENLKWYIKYAPNNCMFNVNTTVSLLNKFSIHELDSWVAENFNANRLGDKITHRKQPATGLFSLDNYKTRTSKIVNFLDNCDKRRGTSWRAVFPDLLESI